MQAKDISDDVAIEAIKQARGKHGVPCWASRWDVHEQLSSFPPKVVNAKMASLVRRKLIGGCGGCHNCRGDFQLECPSGGELIYCACPIT